MTQLWKSNFPTDRKIDFSSYSKLNKEKNIRLYRKRSDRRILYFSYILILFICLLRDIAERYHNYVNEIIINEWFYLSRVMLHLSD